MVLSWLDMAHVGAPEPSDSTLNMIKINARKVFGEQPTRSADGELIVKGAVFKPRKKPVTDEATPSPSNRSAAAPPSSENASAPVTFPGAVNVLSTQHETTDSDDVAAGVASYYELMEELTTRYNCDTVRRKIQRFLARKTMTQAAFLREIQVNHNSFSKFMSYSGRDKGAQNKTYQAALLFFHEHAVDDTPVATTNPTTSSSTTVNTSEPKVSRREQNMRAEAFFNKINNIVLPDPVYVYDDCDEVRRKLHELIEYKTVTQTALMKHLNITTNPLRKFLTTKGKREGCANSVYKLAYIMFEKLRIAQGQPKTKKRLQTEKERPQGYSLKKDPTHYYLATGETLPPELLQH